MVLKMLKGIGRLMLTTGLLCGVGLFLCSSEVKAAAQTPTFDFTYDSLATALGGERFKIKVTNNNDAAGEPMTVTSIGLYSDTGCSTELATFSRSQEIASTGGEHTFAITNEDFIKNLVPAKRLAATYDIKGIKVKYLPIAGGTETTKDIDVSGDSAKALELYLISIPNAYISEYDTNASHDVTNYKIEAYGIDFGYGNPGVAYAGGEYKVYAKGYSDYYLNIYASGTAPKWNEKVGGENAFKEVTSDYIFKGNVDSGSPANVTLNVQYFPKLTNLWYDLAAGEKIYLNNKGWGRSSAIPLVLKNSSGDLGAKDRTVILGKMEIRPTLDGTGTDNVAAWGYSLDTDGKLTFEFGQTSPDKPGLESDERVGLACIAAMAVEKGYDPANPKNPPINNVKTTDSSKIVKLTGYAYPTAVKILKNDTETTSDRLNKSDTLYEYTLKIAPGGADQTLVSSTIISNNTSIAQVIYTPGSSSFKVKAAAPGTAKITVTAKAKGPSGDVTLTEKYLDITVVSLDAVKTRTAINDSKKNFITVGDYKLDIAKLVEEYATDGTNHISGIVPKAIKITSGTDYAEVVDGTKIKGKKEGTATVSIYLNTTDTSGTGDITDVKVDVYPMPTATYNNSARTVTAKIPTRVSTGSDAADTNLRQTTGFKLVMEDSSGNTLYEYTDSKYQKIDSIKNSSSKSVEYTISASDIEGMVTTAASNGKFSNDTTSVKFRVIPMGYKQSNTSDETIKAKSEINGATDTTTVYKVTASGTNFDTTSAYGLDGQTVSLTANPQSGYTFKQWSDGNSSNPRQVKVSASGTRAFQAVAGERVPGAGGTGAAGGADNSGLYDDVPKTAESNSAIWLIVFMVFAVMGTTYALYLQLKAATSKNDK